MTTSSSQDPKATINAVSLLWASTDMAADIASLHAALFDPAWDEDSITRSLDHPGSVSMIARYGYPKATVGFILGQIAADEAEILSIGVMPDWQRQGLGKRLVEGLLRAAGRALVKRIFLEVAVDNTAAMALYGSTGFEETGRRLGYYQRPGAASVDAVTMARTI